MDLTLLLASDLRTIPCVISKVFTDVLDVKARQAWVVLPRDEQQTRKYLRFGSDCRIV